MVLVVLDRLDSINTYWMVLIWIVLLMIVLMMWIVLVPITGIPQREVEISSPRTEGGGNFQANFWWNFPGHFLEVPIFLVEKIKPVVLSQWNFKHHCWKFPAWNFPGHFLELRTKGVELPGLEQKGVEFPHTGID